jgi:phosphopantothenoylcysteine synthetase/decarboxylase
MTAPTASQAGKHSTDPSLEQSLGATSGKRVLVCLTGGIACYKACTIVSRLAQAGARVTVAMSPAATKFVQPLTLQSLSARPVLTSAWESIASDDQLLDPQHIKLAQQSDLVVVAPCTMDCLARLAHGRGDEIVSLLLSAVDRGNTPVLLCPSMNSVMWSQPATQRNVAQLVQDGYLFEGPADGWQACRTVGTGRMSEPEAILARVASLLS